MVYLHIANSSQIFDNFLFFINKNFPEKNNQFFIVSNLKKKFISKEKNIIYTYSKVYSFKGVINLIFLTIELPFFFYRLFFYAKKSKKIYFHGLFDPRIIIFLFIFKKFLKKSSWIMWGGDLYSNYFKKDSKLTLKEKIYFYIDKKVKGNFSSYITFMRGDYKIMQEYCSGKGKLELSFTYPSNLYKEVKLNKQKHNEIWVQLGNSEDPNNNHFEILEKIKHFKDLKIKYFCILSYKEEMTNYKKKVIEKGKEYFKDNFIPVTSFMEYNEYIEFLGNIDIAIFGHNRAQAFGNTTSLLSMEKTIYLKKETSTYETLIHMGIKVKSFDELSTLELFDEKTLKNNKKIMKEKFSEEELVKQWERIFNS